MKIQAWMAAGCNEVVDATINHQVIESAGNLGRVLVDAMKATRVIAPPVRDANTGKELAPMVTVPDHETRLEAVRQTGTLAAALRAKGGNINVGVVNNPGGNGNGGGVNRSFEQRVRELREKNGLRNDEQRLDENIQDAEIIDDGSDDEDDIDDEPEDDQTESLGWEPS